MWRKFMLPITILALVSFAFAGQTDVIGEDQTPVGLVKAKLENGETLTAADKQLIEEYGLLEMPTVPAPYYRDRVQTVASSGIREDLDLTFEDDSDLANWSHHDETNVWTAEAWMATGGVDDSGCLQFTDAGYTFLVKRPVEAASGAEYSLSIAIKNVVFSATNSLNLSITGLSSVEPSVDVPVGTDYVVYELSGVADAGTAGYIRLYSEGGVEAPEVYIDNVVFEEEVPFTGIFEEGFEVWPPVGWTLDPSGADGEWLQGDGTYYGPGSVVEGSSSAYFDVWNYYTGTSGSMTTGAIDLSGATAPRLSFYYWNSSGSDPVDVLVSTDDVTYTSVWTGGTAVSSWEQVIVDLTTYAGNATVYVQFSCTSDYGSTNPNIDALVIEEAPTDPIIGLSADSLGFGGVLLGMSADLVLTISNTGGADLNVTDMVASDAAFTVDPATVVVAANSSEDVTVTFTPAASMDYVGTLTITSDDAGSPHVIDLTGFGAPTAGGPDVFGYTWSNNLDAAGPTYSWIDTTGAIDAGIAFGDDIRGTIDLPFPFYFYGSWYTQITATTNGWIGMGPHTDYASSYWTNTAIPDAALPDNIIAPLWDDFKAGNSAGSTSGYIGIIRYKTVGTEPNRQFVVFFEDLPRNYGETSGFTFQAIIEEGTNNIILQYSDVVGEPGGTQNADNGIGGTIGIENADATDGLLYCYNGAPQGIYDNMAIEFIAPPPPSVAAIEFDPAALDFGVIPAGGTATLDVTITNGGAADLVITDVVSAGPFSATYSGTIVPLASDVVTVSFDPTMADSYEEVLTFNITGDYEGENTLNCIGAAYPATYVEEGFEGGELPFGWEILEITGSPWVVYSSSYSAHTGDYSVKGPYTYSGGESWLLLPQLDITTGDFIQFWLDGSSYSGTDLEIYGSTTGNAPEDFTDLLASYIAGDNMPASYELVTLDLSSYSDVGLYIGFKLIDDNGYSVYVDDFLMPPAVPSSNTLFFSEYMEGSGNNKALEIYNGTGAEVDLADYQIAQSVNGGGWTYFHTFPEGAVLANDDVWTIVNDGASLDYMFDQADEILGYPSVVHHNGDDARALIMVTGAAREDTAWLDIIGVPTEDPGSGWAVAGVANATANHNLMRKAEIETGNTDWAVSAGTTAEDSEWEVYEEDFWYGVGYHNEDYPLPGDNCYLALEYGNTNDPAVTGAIESGGATWYHFYNDGSFDEVVVSLCGSDFDTKLEVWEDCDSLDYLAYNDDACGAQSQVTLPMLPAGDYYAKVYGYGSASGNYELVITGTIGMPDFVVSEMTYTAPETLEVTVTNQGEADSPGYYGTDYHGLYIDGDYMGYVVVSDVALMAGESYTYLLTGLNYDNLGAGDHEIIFECDVDDDVTEGDEDNNLDTLTINIPVPPAVPRHLTAMASGESVNLVWDPAPEESLPPAPERYSGLTDVKEKNVQVHPDVIAKWQRIEEQNSTREALTLGDDCSDPFVVDALPYQDSTTTVGMTNSFTYGNGNDAVYEVTVLADGYLTASTCEGTTFDTKLEIWDADCAVSLAQNDDYCSVRSQITLQVTAGVYHVVVDGYSAGDIEYILDIWWSDVLDAPDIAVTDMWQDGEEVYAEISNIGTLGFTSAYVSCRWYLDGEYIGYQYPAPLEPGEADTLGVTGFSYANFGPGEFNLVLIADYWESVDEQDESNNADSITVVIEEPDYIPTYNVYRDGVEIAADVEPIDFAFTGGYVDQLLPFGDYCYMVTQNLPDLTESGFSNEACAAITPNAPTNLTLMVMPDASADLHWAAPLPGGQIAVDDGTVEGYWWVQDPPGAGDLQAQGLVAPLPAYDIAYIGIYALATVPGTAFDAVQILGVDGDGLPDLTNVLADIDGVTVDATWETGGEWLLIPVDVAMTSPEFYIVTKWIEGEANGPFVGADDDTPGVNAWWTMDGGVNWGVIPNTLMYRAFLDLGGGELVAAAPSGPVQRNVSTPAAPALSNGSVAVGEIGWIPDEANRDFLGTFNVHRGMEPGIYDTTLVEDLADLMYNDLPDTMDMTYYYAVTANYDEGMSPYSNEVSYVPMAVPWLTLDVPVDFGVDLVFGETAGEDTFELGNIGIDTLDFEAIYEAPMGRVVTREIDGAYLYSTNPPPQPGETVTVTLYVQNASGDAEWIDTVRVTWPAGITVNGSSDMTVVGGTNYLQTDGATGDGATIEWWDHNGGYGNIYSDDVAAATVDITVDASFTGDVVLDYFLSGDDFGSEPHEVTGQFVFEWPAFVVSVEPAMGSLLTDEVVDVVATVDVIEYEPGFYPGHILVTHNDPAWDDIIIPFDVNLAPPMGTLAGTVTSSYDDAGIADVEIMISTPEPTRETFYAYTDENGDYTIDLPAGDYDVMATHDDYLPVDGTVSILQDQVATMDMVMDPNVMAPMALNGYEEGGVHLSWFMPVPTMLYHHDGVPESGFYQAWGEAYGAVYDLTPYGDATLESMDFVHYSWGLAGLFEFNIHIVDASVAPWTTIAVLGPFSTTQDAAAAPVFEEGYDLGGMLAGTSFVGIFIEPIGGTADDAYPDLSTDSSPAEPGNSFILDLATMEPWDLDESTWDAGDFLVDLWIIPGMPDETATTTRPPVASAVQLDKATQGSISGWEGMALPIETGLRSEMLNYRVYRSMEGGDWTLVGEPEDAEFVDTDMTPESNYSYQVSAMYDVGESAMSNTFDIYYVNVAELGLPTEYALHQNHPNPFNPVTAVRYDLPEAADVTLTVYNILGQKVVTLVDQAQNAGYHSITWNGLDAAGSQVSSGIYMYRLETGNYSAVKKMMFLK